MKIFRVMSSKIEFFAAISFEGDGVGLVSIFLFYVLLDFNVVLFGMMLILLLMRR